jgi:hypothetical protein
LGSRPLIAGVAWEHEAVDHQRVLAGRKQLGQPQVGRDAVHTFPLEDVVLGDDPTGWKRTPGGSHCLGGAAQLDLLLKQPVARRPVVR